MQFLKILAIIVTVAGLAVMRNILVTHRPEWRRAPAAASVDAVVVAAVVLEELEVLAQLGLGVEVKSSGNCKVG